VIDNLLHPKEFARGDGSEVKQLEEIAEHYTRWQLAHLLGFGAIVLFAVAILGLAFLVRRTRPRAGLAAGVLGIGGLMCLAAVIALDGFTWGILGELFGQTRSPAIVQALADVQQSEWGLQYYVPALGFLIALVLLGVLLARDRIAPTWAGWLLVLGGVLAGTETLITSNAYFIVGSLVLLAGAGGVGLAVARMTDAEFASGARPKP
jgi:hypothetical protein